MLASIKQQEGHTACKNMANTMTTFQTAQIPQVLQSPASAINYTVSKKKPGPLRLI